MFYFFNRKITFRVSFLTQCTGWKNKSKQVWTALVFWMFSISNWDLWQQWFMKDIIWRLPKTIYSFHLTYKQKKNVELKMSKKLFSQVACSKCQYVFHSHLQIHILQLGVKCNLQEHAPEAKCENLSTSYFFVTFFVFPDLHEDSDIFNCSHWWLENIKRCFCANYTFLITALRKENLKIWFAFCLMPTGRRLLLRFLKC